MSVLADTSRGVNMEIIVAIYKAISLSLLNILAQFGHHFLVIYNGEAYKRPNIIHFKLQPDVDLHEETRMLSIRNHNVLLTREYLKT